MSNQNSHKIYQIESLSNLDVATLSETPALVKINEEVTATIELDQKVVMVEVKANSWDKHIARVELVFAHSTQQAKTVLYKQIVTINSETSIRDDASCELAALEEHATAMASASFLIKLLKDSRYEAICHVLDKQRAERQRERRAQRALGGSNSADILNMELNEDELTHQESYLYVEEIKKLLKEDNQISQKLIRVKTSDDVANRNGGVVQFFQYLAKLVDGKCIWVDVSGSEQKTIPEEEMPSLLWRKVFA